MFSPFLDIFVSSISSILTKELTVLKIDYCGERATNGMLLNRFLQKIVQKSQKEVDNLDMLIASSDNIMYNYKEIL